MANIFKYTDAVGPAWVDGTSGFTITFNVQTPTQSRTFTWPDAAGTVALIGNTGTVTTGTWNGTKIGLAYGGTNADLSATGGTSRVLKQITTGAAVTVAQLALADLSDAATVALAANVPILPTNPPTAAPGTGDTLNFVLTGDITKGILNPAGTLAELTVGLPDGDYGGQIFTLFTSAIVTALTLTGNFSATIGMAQPTTLAANQRVDWVWDGSSGDWLRDR